MGGQRKTNGQAAVNTEYVLEQLWTKEWQLQGYFHTLLYLDEYNIAMQKTKN